MEFRNNEIVCWVIPGIYLMVIALCIIGFPAEINTDLKQVTEGTVTLLIFAIPIVGFIIGYALNYIGSWLEWCLYRIGFKRSSYRILNNTSCRTQLANRAEIIDKLRAKITNLPSHDSAQKIDNSTARLYLMFAKEELDREGIQSFYYLCTFSRNLCVAQLIIALIVVGAVVLIDLHILTLVGTLILLCIFFFAWRRKCDCYVKECFAEFYKKNK